MKKLSTSILLILSIVFAASVSVGSQAWFPDGLQSKGSVTIGEKATADSKAVLDVRSTTKGFLPPRMTTTQRDAIASPPAGLTVYNTTTNKLNQFNGTAWGEVAGSGSSGAQYNTLTNYNFEDTTYSTGWTASGGTLAAAAGSNILFNSQSATWDSSSASQTLSYDAITVGQGYKGNNCEGAIYVQTPSGTATHFLQVFDGTYVLASTTVTTSTTPKEVSTGAFPCPTSGTIQLRLLSFASNEPLIAVDNAYLGLARNLGVTQINTAPVSYTPTIGVTGGTTTASGMWQRIGPDIEVWGDVTFTTVFTGGTMTVGLPSVCTIDTARMPVTPATGVGIIDSRVYLYDVGSGQYPGMVTYNNTSSVLIRTLQDDVGASADYIMADRNVTTLLPFTWANGDRMSFRFKVPCVGWDAQNVASIDAISKRGSIYFASGSASVTSGSATTFNVAGFGTNTLEGQALAPTTANDLGIRMTGAPAAAYEVNVTGVFYSHRNSAQTGTNCIYDLYDGTTSRGNLVAGAPNVSGVSTLDGIGSLSGTFTLSSAGTINVVVRGQRTAGDGTCYADGPISISIKNVSQQSPAMIITSGVTTTVSNGVKILTAKVQAVNGSMCIVSEEDGDWLGSTTPLAAGRCTVAINAGVFSAAPKCVLTGYATTYTGATQQLTGHLSAVSTSAITFEARYHTGGAGAVGTDDSPFMLMCVGAR